MLTQYCFYNQYKDQYKEWKNECYHQCCYALVHSSWLFQVQNIITVLFASWSWNECWLNTAFTNSIKSGGSSSWSSEYHYCFIWFLDLEWVMTQYCIYNISHEIKPFKFRLFQRFHQGTQTFKRLCIQKLGKFDCKDGRFRLQNRSRNRNRLQIWPIWNRSRNRNQLFRNQNQNNGPESEPEPCIMEYVHNYTVYCMYCFADPTCALVYVLLFYATVH